MQVKIKSYKKKKLCKNKFHKSTDELKPKFVSSCLLISTKTLITVNKEKAVCSVGITELIYLVVARFN